MRMVQMVHAKPIRSLTLDGIAYGIRCGGALFRVPSRPDAIEGAAENRPDETLASRVTLRRTINTHGRVCMLVL